MRKITNRHDHGRAATAAAIIDRVLRKLPASSPVRADLRELEALFGGTTDNIRELLDRIPGSFAKKGERIGIPRGAVFALWHGKYRASADIMALIKTAAEAGHGD